MDSQAKLVNKRLFNRLYRLSAEQVDIFLTALVLAATLLFFAPVNVYQMNINAVDFNLSDVSGYYLLISLAGAGVLSILLLGMSKIYARSIHIFIGICAGFILQGNFLNYDLGKLSGQEINWAYIQQNAKYEYLIWFALAAIAILLENQLQKHLRFIILILFLMQAVPAASLGLLKLGSEPSRYYYSNENAFTFSRDKNIILIVLDSYRGDTLDLILEQSPQYKVSFKDFTNFTNAMSGFPSTYPSIPLILSGVYYDNSIPIQNYLSLTKSASLPAVLRNQQFIVEQYSCCPVAYGSVWDNSSEKFPKNQKILLSLENQYTIAFAKYLPLRLKPYFIDRYYAGFQFAHKSLLDFHENSQLIKIDNNRYFKFFHLSGVHPPFQIDQNATRSHENSQTSYIEQASANIKIVTEFLERLQDNGVYNQSLILIVSDHGIPDKLALGLPKVPDQISSEPPGAISEELLDLSRSVLLVKRFDEEHAEMQISDAPVTLGDLSNTIFKEVDLSPVSDSPSIFDPIDLARERFFYYYEWQNKDWNEDYLPVISIFKVVGNVGELQSWGFIDQLVPNK